MKTLDQIKRDFCSTVDVIGLQKLLMEAISLIEFEQASSAFLKHKIVSSDNQIKVLMGNIENLEKTLWNRK